MQLKSKTIKGSFWLFSLRIVTRLVGLIRTVILARILLPKQFGLVAIGTLIIGFLEVFTRSGLTHSLIQSGEVEKREWHTVWTFRLLRGILLGVLMFFGAPLLSRLFASTGSLPIIRVLAITPILRLGESIGKVKATKEVEFRLVGMVEVLGTMASAVVGISWALIWPSVWALVAASVSNKAFRTLFSYVLFDTKPQISWNIDIIKKHFKYGYQIWLTAMTQYSYNNGDDWLVGRFLGESALGLYRKAYRLGNLVTTELVLVLNRVLFPSFSKLKDDNVKLWNSFISIEKTIGILVWPITTIIIFFANPLIKVILGSQWIPMTVAFQLLAVWGAFRAHREVMGSIFRAIGHPRVMAGTTFLKLVLIVSLFWPIKQYGIEGVALLVVATSMLEFPILLYLCSRYLKSKIRSFFRVVTVPPALALLATLLIYQLTVKFNSGYLLTLFVGVLGSGLLYLILLLIADFLDDVSYFSEIYSVFSEIRKRL